MHSRTGLIFALLRKGASPSQIVTQLEIRKALSDCFSVLDVGCGSDSMLSLMGLERLVGIEGFAQSLEIARKNQTHHELVLGDVRDLRRHFKEDQFDACVGLDVIEHLTKEDGLKMLRDMERIATRRVIIVTPSGFLPQGHTEQADLQEHLSGWEAAEMQQLGYRVVGILGPKKFRGEYHRIRWKPAFFWLLVSLLGHWLYTRRNPSASAALLCVKSKHWQTEPR